MTYVWTGDHWYLAGHPNVTDAGRRLSRDGLEFDTYPDDWHFYPTPTEPEATQ